MRLGFLQLLNLIILQFKEKAPELELLELFLNS